MSVSPDEGMQLLAQHYTADHATRQGAPPEQAAPGTPSAGGGLEIGAMLGVMARAASSMEGMAAEMRAARGRLSFQNCHPVQLHPITAAAAVSNLGRGDERWGPQDGWAWDVRGISVTFGAGTTSVTVARDINDPSGAWNKFTFDPPASGATSVWHPGSKSLILLPGQQLVFASVAGGLTANGEAIEIAIDCLADYLGVK